ncbi:LANO_0F13564g1_1 [Lachancea nothofagi CBS 11611]|uniref:LANO_0F13564g1_1 n=1 Tax=Lachancea nothofagi CBS 11611 TaxID=1266666 RepID=A0A1G4KBW3_9SACH|nr:LANO_0F13564g1_1 [Lachancea nothofagi CBS 11611]
MVVIVASLFLPFQPQFEVSGTEADRAAVLEHEAVKAPQSNTGGAGSLEGSDPTRRNRTSSVHSSSPFSNPENVAPDLLDYQSAIVSRDTEPNAKAASPSISSEMFMENLTANAVNTGAGGTPVNPVHNTGNTSVEEFFSSHPGSAMQAVFGPSGVSSRNYSVTSTPGAEGILSPTPQHDSTANLLKNVNKSLYQNMFTSSGSPIPAAAFEGKSQPHASQPTSTVITPKSRDVPDLNSSVVDLPKAKQQQQQQYSLPAMRRVHRKSSGAAQLAADSKDHKGAQHYPPKHPLRTHESGRHISSALKNEVIEESDSDDNFSYNEDDECYEKSTVPQFGGYSINAKTRASLLMGSKNIFAQVPWKIVASGKGNGGLKNAISTAASEKTIEESVKWVGTMGIPTDSIPQSVLQKVSHELENNYECAPVISDDITFKVAYKNFCKQILWPTLHYQIPDNPNSKAFEDHSWNYYQDLNQLFADKIVESYKEGDTIWIHDYHLMLAPGMVRAKLPNAKIGFFLHVSFPSSEVFRCFAQRENILNGIVGANYVGFQTEEYARHFLQTTNRLLMTDVDRSTLKYKGRIIKVGNEPIGIDAFILEAQLKAEQVENWRRLIRSRWAGKKLIVGRDQFDRIRGLKKKLLAYERFLRANPECVSQVVLIQICLGSEKDPELEREIMIVIDRINALSPDISVSQPVVFLHQDLDFAQYLALNSEADLFLVSTMREGMNLTCHEFIVCSRENNAPLLLSEFTGSADIMKNGAFLINPWDIKQVAQTIKRALNLPVEEKRRRWKQLYKSIMKNDSDFWIKHSLTGIFTSWDFNQERSTVFNLSYDTILSSYKAAKKRVFIFKISEPPTARALSILSDLCADSIVYVFSSFSRNMMERLYTRLSHVGLIAENGAYVRLNGRWFSIVEDNSWKADIAKVIEDKVERLPGSYYKVGESMIRFHTENADDKDRVSGVIGEAITHVNTLFGDRGIHAYLHKNIVFVQQVGLALKALHFLMAYFNSVNSNRNSTPQHSVENSPLLSPIMGPSMSAGLMSPSTQSASNSYFSLGRSIAHVDFMAVTGSTSPVVEPLFEYVNDLVKKKHLKAGYSVVYGVSPSTYAKEHIEGLNELLSMLEKLNTAHQDFSNP